MNKIKNIIIIGLLLVGFAPLVYGLSQTIDLTAPYHMTGRWWFDLASSTDMTISGKLYDSSNSIGTNGQVLKSTGSAIQWGDTTTGTGNVSTSTSETPGYLSYWTSTSATPALLGKVATTTASCSGSASCASFTVIGSSPVTISATGGSSTGSPNSVAMFDGSGNLTSSSSPTFTAFTATSTTATSTIWAALGIGVAPALVTAPLEVNGGAFSLEQTLATSTSMTVDFCQPSNNLRMGVGTSNITFTWTNYANCLGKTNTLEVYTPDAGLIGSTTITAANFRWDGDVNPGNSTSWGSIDTFSCHSTTGTSTPLVWCALISTIP